eukprot:GHVQ01036883.1.p1 GENE.GHVQ01036883.1~~GHVQ01036883.1.p1  ORF type:complete len:1027 (+),score=154.22 GHVQ01036883.1:292-3372(+)
MADLPSLDLSSPSSYPTQPLLDSHSHPLPRQTSQIHSISSLLPSSHPHPHPCSYTPPCPVTTNLTPLSSSPHHQRIPPPHTIQHQRSRVTHGWCGEDSCRTHLSSVPCSVAGVSWRTRLCAWWSRRCSCICGDGRGGGVCVDGVASSGEAGCGGRGDREGGQGVCRWVRAVGPVAGSGRWPSLALFKKKDVKISEDDMWNVKTMYWLTISSTIFFSVNQSAVFDNYLYILVGRSNKWVGYGESVSGLTSLASALPVGYAVDRWDRTQIARMSTLIGIIATSINAVGLLYDNYRILLLSLFVWGIFWEMACSSSDAIFTDSLPRGLRTKAFTTRGIVTMICSGGGPVILVVYFRLVRADIWNLYVIHRPLVISCLLFGPLSSLLMSTFRKPSPHTPYPQLSPSTARNTPVSSPRLTAVVARDEGEKTSSVSSGEIAVCGDRLGGEGGGADRLSSGIVPGHSGGEVSGLSGGELGDGSDGGSCISEALSEGENPYRMWSEHLHNLPTEQSPTTEGGDDGREESVCVYRRIGFSKETTSPWTERVPCTTKRRRRASRLCEPGMFCGSSSSLDDEMAFTAESADAHRCTDDEEASGDVDDAVGRGGLRGDGGDSKLGGAEGRGEGGVGEDGERIREVVGLHELQVGERRGRGEKRRDDNRSAWCVLVRGCSLGDPSTHGSPEVLDQHGRKRLPHMDKTYFTPPDTVSSRESSRCSDMRSPLLSPPVLSSTIYPIHLSPSYSKAHDSHYDLYDRSSVATSNRTPPHTHSGLPEDGYGVDAVGNAAGVLSHSTKMPLYVHSMLHSGGGGVRNRQLVDECETVGTRERRGERSQKREKLRGRSQRHGTTSVVYDDMRIDSMTQWQRLIPYIVALSDFVRCVGSGMTVKFFPLFFKNDYGFLPDQICFLLLVYAVVTGLFMAVAERLANIIGTVILCSFFMSLPHFFCSLALSHPRCTAICLHLFVLLYVQRSAPVRPPVRVQTAVRTRVLVLYTLLRPPTSTHVVTPLRYHNLPYCQVAVSRPSYTLLVVYYS